MLDQILLIETLKSKREGYVLRCKECERLSNSNAYPTELENSITESLNEKKIVWQHVIVSEEIPTEAKTEVVELSDSQVDKLLFEVFGDKQMNSACFCESPNDTDYMCKPITYKVFEESDISDAVERLKKGRGYVGMNETVNVLRWYDKLDKNTSYLVSVSW